MLISEFARAAELPPDTVRFYVRRGLLKPLVGKKGGANPYQVFTAEHVQMARMIRIGQSLGFSLREIEAFNLEYQAKRLTATRGAEILRGQLVRLEEKAAHIGAMIGYIHAKLAWMETGGQGPEPNFTDYEQASTRGTPGRNSRKRAAAAAKFAPRSVRRFAGAGRTLAK